MGKYHSKTRKKSVAESDKGVLTGMKHIYLSFKRNPGGAIVIAIVTLLITGIFNAFLGNFYNSCSEVMSNASVGFFHKIADLYYATAAKTELTDASLEVTWVIYWLMIGGLWMCRDLFKIEVDKEKDALQELIDIGVKIQNLGEEKHETTDLANRVKHLKEEQRRLKNICEKRIEKSQRKQFWINLVVILFTINLLFSLSLMAFSYAKVKSFKRSVTAIRPYISDTEDQRLNRQWVMMKSRRDYKAIKAKIAEYEKRAEADKKPNAEDE